MRVYHFVNAKHGLSNIAHRRLKVALLNELNDPFEWLSVELSDPEKRFAVQETKNTQAQRRGLLCFSRIWKNPVMWGHYADKHRGVCLGFDFSDEWCREVDYVAKRLSSEWIEADLPDVEKERHMSAMLYTKYKHWAYEREVRVTVDLSGMDKIGDYYFYKWEDFCVLKEVIVGAESAVTQSDITTALGTQADGVDLRKARLAFRSFNVVEHRGFKWRKTS